jgi:hypothetical protein
MTSDLVFWKILIVDRSTILFNAEQHSVVCNSSVQLHDNYFVITTINHDNYYNKIYCAIWISFTNHDTVHATISEISIAPPMEVV